MIYLAAAGVFVACVGGAYWLGLWQGRKGAAAAAVTASMTEEKHAIVVAADAEATIVATAATTVTALAAETPEQVLERLKALPKP